MKQQIIGIKRKNNPLLCLYRILRRQHGTSRPLLCITIQREVASHRYVFIAKLCRINKSTIGTITWQKLHHPSVLTTGEQLLVLVHTLVQAQCSRLTKQVVLLMRTRGKSNAQHECYDDKTIYFFHNSIIFI